MSKLNMASIVARVQKEFKSDPKLAAKIRLGSDLRKVDAERCIKMPSWWTEATNTPGIPFGKMVMIAGKTDSGKTSAAIVAMKQAIDQGVAVIYVETEGKTTPQDLSDRGIDPSQIFLIQTVIAEQAFTMLMSAVDAIKDANPESHILVVFDSFGNTLSMRDSELNMIEDKQQIGGKGKANRLGLSKLIAKMEEDDFAVLFINYTYNQLGSPGTSNAGGEAVNLFSSLTYQTRRKRWLEKTVKGKVQRVGAEVEWTLYKNHINKANPGPKKVLFQITAEGISYVGGDQATQNDSDEDSE